MRRGALSIRGRVCGRALLSLVLGCVDICAALGALPEGFPVAQILDHRSGFTGSFPSSVVVDRDGRIWVSSDLGGLFVGDGIRFLKVELPPELTGKKIGDIAADRSGRIWVLSAGGLGTWAGGVWQVDPGIRQQDPLNPLRTDGIFSHPSGALAVLASGRAYVIPSGGRPQARALPGRDDDGDVGLAWAGDSLVANRGGRFWREGHDGWTPLPTILLSATERPRGPLRADVAGHLYLLTDLHLYHLAPAGERWDIAPDVRPAGSDRMTSLQDGRIWILQNGQALCGLRGKITRDLMPSNVTMHGAMARCLDAERNLWISSTSLVRVPAFGVVREHAGPGYPPSNAVWQILRDRAGALWAALETGLFRRDDSGWHSVPGVPKAHNMEVGPDGWLYVSDRDRLMRVEMRTLKAESVSIPLLSEGEAVRRGPVIQGDKLWISDARGRLIQGIRRNGRWTWTWDNLPGSAGKAVVDLMMDDIGRAWAIQSDRVFCRFEETWEELPKLSGTGGGGPMGLSFRSKEEGFAAQYDPPAVVAVRRSSSGWTAHTLIGPDELRDIGVLYSIRQDSKGTIWLGTDRGVVRVELGDPLRIRRFGTDMGLPSEDTNQGALLVEGLERIWVGTALGLAEIRAGEMAPLPPMAAPSILEVRHGSQASQGPDSVLKVRYGQGSVAWELGFPGPVRGDRARFEFRTIGGTWTALSGTALQFPSIPAGDHPYEVRVVPSLGPPGAFRRLEMYVHPPWYRHTFFYFLLGLIAAGLLIGVFRARVVLLERRNRELNKAVQAATKELKQHRENLEKLVDRRTADLNERIKELRCGYGISRLIAEPDRTVEEVLEKAVAIVLSGLTRPETACARIVFDGREYATESFKETPWKHSAAMAVSGKSAGSLEVFYLEERPGPAEGPFLKEEKELIDDLGLQLGVMVENKLAQRAIQASLREKEALLREIHHRVKNNLQVISSLMSLQAERIPDEGARKMLKESQARIRSMAFIHEKLYQSRDLSKVDFASYIRSLAASLFQSYRLDPGQVRLETELEDVGIDINSAGPCGLVVNELVSNALKHAFPEGRKGTVRIGLRREADGTITLRVADDGVGFPEALDFRKADSFGLQILGLLVEQLDAKIELDRTNGTAFTISFRELEYKPRI